MFQFDIEDDDKFECSALDKARIEDLDIGEQMEAENDSFRILRQINGYNILCSNGAQRGHFVCPTLESTLQFLENN